MVKVLSDGLKNILSVAKIEKIDYYNEVYLDEQEAETWYVWEITDIFGKQNNFSLLALPNVINIINITDPKEVPVFNNRDTVYDTDIGAEDSEYFEKTFSKKITYDVLFKYPKEKYTIKEDETGKEAIVLGNTFDLENKIYAFSKYADPLNLDENTLFFNEQVKSKLDDSQSEEWMFEVSLSQFKKLKLEKNNMLALVNLTEDKILDSANEFTIETGDSILFGNPNVVSTNDAGLTGNYKTVVTDKQNSNLFPIKVNLEKFTDNEMRLYIPYLDYTKSYAFYKTKAWNKGFTFNRENITPYSLFRTNFNKTWMLFQTEPSDDINKETGTSVCGFLVDLFERIYEVSNLYRSNFADITERDNNAGSRIKAILNNKPPKDVAFFVDSMISKATQELAAKNTFSGWLDTDNLFNFTVAPISQQSGYYRAPTTEDWNIFYSILASCSKFIYSESCYEYGGNTIIQTQQLCYFDEKIKSSELSVKNKIPQIKENNINLVLTSSLSKLNSIESFYGKTIKKEWKAIKETPTNLEAPAYLDNWWLSKRTDSKKSTDTLLKSNYIYLTNRDAKNKATTKNGGFLSLTKNEDPDAPYGVNGSDLMLKGTILGWANDGTNYTTTETLLGVLFSFSGLENINRQKLTVPAQSSYKSFAGSAATLYPYEISNLGASIAYNGGLARSWSGYVRKEYSLTLDQLRQWRNITSWSKNNGITSGIQEYLIRELPYRTEILEFYNKLSQTEKATVKFKYTFEIIDFMNYWWNNGLNNKIQEKDKKTNSSGAYIKSIACEIIYNTDKSTTKQGIIPTLEISNLGSSVINNKSYLTSLITPSGDLEEQKIPLYLSSIEDKDFYNKYWFFADYNTLMNILTTDSTIDSTKALITNNIPYVNMETLFSTPQDYTFKVSGANKIKNIILSFIGNGVISLTIYNKDKTKNVNLNLKLSNDLNNNINKLIINI